MSNAFIRFGLLLCITGLVGQLFFPGLMVNIISISAIGAGFIYITRSAFRTVYWDKECDRLVDHLSKKLINQFSSIKNENDQILRLLRDAISTLDRNFKALEEHTRGQQEVIAGFTSPNDGQSAHGFGNDFLRFINKTSEHLNFFVENVGGTHEFRRHFVEETEDVSRTIGVVLEDTEGIETISRQTRILAINATVEAAHAGHFGKSFSVVAKEVQRLAIQSAECSQRIRAHLREARNALIKAQMRTQTLSENASRHMDFTVEMMKQAKHLNGKVTDGVSQISDKTAKIAQNVSNAVTALQFEDLIRQLVERVGERTEIMENLLHKVRHLTNNLKGLNSGDRKQVIRAHDLFEEVKMLVEEAALNFEKLGKCGVAQQSIEEGTVDLF